MEGVPRLYMIGIPAKRCVDDRTPDFATSLNHHISQSYDRDPSLYSADIDTLLELRQSAINAVMSSVCSVDDCTALKRYYAHLVRITDKFPKLMKQPIVGVNESYENVEITKTGEPTPALTFTWKQTLGGKTNLHANNIDAASMVDNGDIGFEMRCILYNLGAAHSRLASAQDRSPPLVTSNMSTTVGEESPSNTALKIACTHLQCSAWAFQQLLGSGETNNEHTKWHHRQQPPVTSRAVLEFAYNVTLAQAQECILEKSMMDGRKPLIIAKVSAMICEYFAGAVNAVLRVGREPYCVSANRIEKWRLYSEFKCRYYGAITALFQGQHVQDQLQQMGTRVSYYRRAVNLLGRAGQISENGGKTMTLVSREDDSADDDYYYYLDSKAGRIGSGRLAATKELEMRRDTLSFAMDVAAAKWRAAKSENELIYHEPVVPVLSDEDDSDCLGNVSSSTSSSHRKLDRVKGASLVKPIGFSVDDPELLAVVVNINESCTTTTTTLFRDIVPTVTRHRAATYRTEKSTMEAYIQSLCQEADDRLTAFADKLNLECLDMYNGNNDCDENNVKNELPQKLVNCCAAYQALLNQRREERERDPSCANIEDQLDIDMDRLSAAVQAVDGMLDEIDRLLKTEELGDSEYRRTVGRPYDYSAGRMRELRREATRYREAHVGRARDSWVTLSRAVRDRRRRDLELLALPPDELAARLPPARPSLSAIASEVTAAGGIDSNSYHSAESSDPNEDSESDDDTGGRLRQSQRESIMRLDRLKMVVGKMQEMREQRQILLSRLREEMNQEDKDAAAAGQDDSDVLVELRGSNLDVSMVVKKKLDDRYGTTLNLIERNLAAQQYVLDAVRTAYVRAAHERRAYANAIQRRQTLVASLLDAYDGFVVANGGTPTENISDVMAASPTSGLLPDTVLAERCAKGLDFYQRMITNVSKLLQRVKGACQVQTEQRDQIIKQHRQWETITQQSDDDPATNIGGLDDLLAAVSAVDDQDHNQDDLAALIESFGSSVGSNKPPVPLGGHWNQQHHLRRLSPLGSEQQKQHYHQYSHSQTQPPSSSTFTTGVSGGVIDYYDYYYKDRSDTNKANTGPNSNVSTALQQQQPATHTMYPTVTAEYNVAVGSTAMASPINSTVASLSSPMPYNYYNYQLPTASSAINPTLSSPSYNNIGPITGSSTDVSATSVMNATHLETNTGSVSNIVSSYSQNSGFPNAAAAAAVAVLQRPLPTPYIGSNSNIANITAGIGYGASRGLGYHQPTPVLPTQQQQFYSQQYQQQISTPPSITSGTTGVGTAGVFLQQQQQLIASDNLSASAQSPLPLSSPSISLTSVNNSGKVNSVHSSIAISANANYFQQLPAQQQLPQLYQQQQPQMYQQQQQLQLYQQQQQQPQMYQQPQQQPQLANIGQNASGNVHYPQSLQQNQQPSQLYQSQHQIQPNTLTTNQQQPSSSLTNNSSGGNNYYQQLQQYHPTTTVAPLNTTTMYHNNYYYQQPSMATPPVVFNQQHQQYYQQQFPAVISTPIPVVNLLDDDLVISGPPPIQPEKISTIGGNDSSTSTSIASKIN